MTLAIQIHGYGPPEVLRPGQVVMAPLGARDVRIQTVAAAVNHTDLEIRAGVWPVRKPDPFPYVPGVEVVGTIHALGADVSGWSVGDMVITMMQGLGGVRAERSGGYAELVTVAADALAGVPAGVDPLAMSALGLGGVTAYHGLRRMGDVAGKRILVTGAAGGVGSAAVSVARAMGATVVGVISRPEQKDYVLSLGAADVIASPKGAPLRLPTDSVDGVFDVVGGPLFAHGVDALKAGGTLSLVGAVAGGRVEFDAWNLIRPVTLTGYSTETLDGRQLRQAVASLSSWLERGTIRPPDHTTVALHKAADAHRLIEGGGVSGRVLLIPSSR